MTARGGAAGGVSCRARPGRAASWAWVVLALGAAGCAGPGIRFESVQTAPSVRARAKELEALARREWHLPLRIRVYLSNAERAGHLPLGQFEAEEALALAQLEELEQAYRRAAFDLFEAEVSIEPVSRPQAEVDGPLRTLRVRLPLPEDEAARPIPAQTLLEALAAGFSWDATGPWYRGERGGELDAALARDLHKLDQLEDELSLQNARLELLAGELVARGGDDPPALTPSEAGFARDAQLRALLALHRVLNTLARWRAAGEDSAFRERDAALVVLLRARLIHEAALGRLLQTVVGGRTATRFWEVSFWHRNPLYKALDAAADLQPLADQGRVERIPAGSIRALLGLRLDGGLRGYCADLDRRAVGLEARLGRSALAEELLQAWPKVQAGRAAVERWSISGFSAWKELWDAGWKDSVRFPLYQVISGVSRFLGHTRLSLREPAIRPAQLAALEGALLPGDIILVREDGYLSNAFLPGFWPHALLWLGPGPGFLSLRLPDGRALGEDPAVQQAMAAGWREDDPDGPPRVMEAVSDGVVFSPVSRALRKDYLVVLRPLLPPTEVAAALRWALVYQGRPYDFEFDFASDDKLVCTELVYRAYDPLLNFRAQLDVGGTPRIPGVIPVLGRLTMPAQEVAALAVFMAEHPEPDPVRGYPGRRLELVRLFDRGEAGAAEYEGTSGLEALRGTLSR